MHAAKYFKFPGVSNPIFRTPRDITGVVWTLGFAIESITDAQELQVEVSIVRPCQ